MRHLRILISSSALVLFLFYPSPYPEGSGGAGKSIVVSAKNQISTADLELPTAH
ncbi:hypothetical protein [Salinimicrobium xinjiangense]|uniref:hypothetical protein n=1 Tax=Salinimicrobium xinjiangense TaxID=438596 RepID=UPI0004205C9F|nr:hypothetical protein [Salinimicrobium xinjiangense]